MVLQIAKHIRWSQDKYGAIKIFNRLGLEKTVYIKSKSGITIWRTLATGQHAARGVTLKDLLEELIILFGRQASSCIIEQDLQQFIDQLITAKIIGKSPDKGVSDISVDSSGKHEQHIAE
jgi:hypothetical protein